MVLVLDTAPGAAVMTPAELGDHVRLASGFGADAGAGGADDPALIRAVAAATATVERSLSTALIRQRWLWSFQRWRPIATDPAATRLPLAPVLSATSIDLIADDGAATAWAATAWSVDIRLGALRALGAGPPHPGGGFRVLFEAGFGDVASDVPADLRHAVALLAAHYFERRHAGDDDRLTALPYGVETLLAPWRRPRL